VGGFLGLLASVARVDVGAHDGAAPNHFSRFLAHDGHYSGAWRRHAMPLGFAAWNGAGTLQVGQYSCAFPIKPLKTTLGRNRFSEVCNMKANDNEFQRLRELQAISVGLNSANAYFQPKDSKFTDPLKRKYFLRIEEDLRGLTFEAWGDLKEAAAQRLIRTKDRDWQPLFDTLNEAKAYNYLISIGCTSVQFIPRSRRAGVRTPDLQAMSGKQMTVCEVKTINISKNEIERLRNGGVGTTLLAVEDGLLNKLASDLRNAENQMSKFCSIDDARKIIYVIVNFDNNFDMALEYQAQVRAHVDSVKPPGIEVVLFFKAPFER
jgi:hypothetical protein